MPHEVVAELYELNLSQSEISSINDLSCMETTEARNSRLGDYEEEDAQEDEQSTQKTLAVGPSGVKVKKRGRKRKYNDDDDIFLNPIDSEAATQPEGPVTVASIMNQVFANKIS